MRRKKVRKPIAVGDVVGGFRVVSHHCDELFHCECAEVGHKEIRSRATLLSPTSVCKKCKRLKMYGENIGKTFGSVTITGLTERPGVRKGRESETQTLYAYQCACGREGTVGVHSVINGDVTGRNCDGCREKKLEAAMATNDPLRFTNDEVTQLRTAMRSGILTILSARDAGEWMEDIAAQCWVELLQYDLNGKTFRQICAVAHTLGKRIGLSHIQGVRDEHKMQMNPKEIDADGEPMSDIFDELNIEKAEPTEGYELQMAALDTLSPDEKSFLLDFSTRRGAKSKKQKARFNELTAKVRTAHADILVAINEEGATNAVAA